MIIDAHAHLGDVLWPDGGRVIRRKGLSSSFFLDPISLDEALVFREPKLFGRFLRRLLAGRITRAEQARSACASLENMMASMDKNGVSHCVCLPVSPCVVFEDIAAPAGETSRLLPFTTLRLDLADKMEEAAKRDAQAGAVGVKLHAILQNTSYTDPVTYSALEVIQSLGLPVLFHCGEWAYYLPRDPRRDTPHLGQISYAKKMVADFPKLRFIAGHAGLFEVREAIRELAGCKNVAVDTSFQPPETIRDLAAAFGPDRVLFGSDWPFGNQGPSIKSVKLACRNDKPLANRILYDNAAELFGLR